MILFFAFSPQRPLYREPLFWASVCLPLLIGLGMVLTTLPMSYTFSWTAQGFNLFFDLAKLPLTIASLSLPLGTISAVMHRSVQTARQIELSLELSRFKDFIEHRKSVIEEFKGLLPESWSNRTVNHFYKVIFDKSLRREYQPKLPCSWLLLYQMIKECSNDIAFGNFFDVSYLEQLATEEGLTELIELKSQFIVDIAKLLDESISFFDPEWTDFDVFERNGISDDDDFFYKCSDLASDCRNMFRKLNELATALIDSSVYHFLSSEQASLLAFLSTSEIYYDVEPNIDFEVFLGEEGGDIVRNIMRGDYGEKKNNGDLVALTFRIMQPSIY